MQAIELRTDYLKDPIGLGDRTPEFFWKCAGGKKQTASFPLVRGIGILLCVPCHNTVYASPPCTKQAGRAGICFRIKAISSCWIYTLSAEFGSWHSCHLGGSAEQRL